MYTFVSGNAKLTFKCMDSMAQSFRRIRKFFREYKREIKFVLIFVLIFGVAQSLYYFSRPLMIPTTFQKSNAAVSAFIINKITPSEEAFTDGLKLKSGGFTLEIAWGCEGVEGMFLVIAALAAFGMRRRYKILGMAAGTVFLYMLNLVRIISLYYTVKYHPTMFDIMHVYVGQTFIIFFGVMFFVVWTYFFSEQPAASGSQNPTAV